MTAVPVRGEESVASDHTLVVAPNGWRVWANLITGAVGAAATLTVAVRVRGGDGDPLTRLAAFRRPPLTADPGRPPPGGRAA